MLSKGRGGGSGKADAFGDGYGSGKGGNGSFKGSGSTRGGKAAADKDDDDDKEDASNGGNVRTEARMKTKEALRAHLKTSQPKRSILKKSETQLDAAAEGDEEALLRIAKSMAAAPSGIPTALFTASGKVTPIRADSGRLNASSNGTMAVSRADPLRESHSSSSTSDDSDDDDDAFSHSSKNETAGGRQMPGSPGGVRANVGRAYNLGHEGAGPRSSCPGSPVGSPGQQRSGSPLQRGDSSPRLCSGTPVTPTAVHSPYGAPSIITTPTSRLANSTDSKTLPSTTLTSSISRLATHGTAGAIANRLSYNGTPRTPPPRAMSLAGMATGSYGMETLHEENGNGSAAPALVLPQRVLRRPDSERPRNGGWAAGDGGGGGASAPLAAWQTSELASDRPASPGAVQGFGGGVGSPRAVSPNPDMIRLVSATESVGGPAVAAAAAAVDSPKGRGARSQLTAATREDIMRSLPPGACGGAEGRGRKGTVTAALCCHFPYATPHVVSPKCWASTRVGR